jgi:uncharacterized membrane protein
MNWKQFLKPNKKKIAIFVALVILIFVSVMIYELSKPFGSTLCDTEECSIEREAMYARENLNDTLFLLTASPFLAILLSLGDLAHSNYGLYEALSWILFILSFVYWYVISCLIFWIYDNFRKVKKK